MDTRIRYLYTLSLCALITHTLLLFSLIFSLTQSKPLPGIPFFAFFTTFALHRLYTWLFPTEKTPTRLKCIIGLTIMCVMGANATILYLKFRGNSGCLKSVGILIAFFDLLLCGLYASFVWGVVGRVNALIQDEKRFLLDTSSLEGEFVEVKIVT